MPDLEPPQDPEVQRTLSASPLFGPLGPAALQALSACLDRRSWREAAAGEALVREGEAAEDLLLLARGHAAVLKRAAGGAEHEVNRVGPGDTVGELALLDPAPRSATVRALEPVRWLVLPLATLRDLAARDAAFAAALPAMSRQVVARLRESTARVVDSLEQALEEARTREAMGRFTFVLIVAYSLYTWLLGTATQVKQLLGRSELVTVPVVLATVAMLLVFMKTSGYPAAFFGLTFRRAGRDMAEALLFTLPLMAAVVALKAWMVTAVPSMAGQPLFQMFAPAADAAAASRFSPGLTLAYVLFVPLQELIYRGGLQGALAHFLTGRWRTPMAVFGSNVIFSAGHLYISPGLSLSAFVAGLFWGWLYARQRALAGVSLSHVVLGFWAFEVVDLGVLE